MKRRRFNEEQIVRVVKPIEGGIPVSEAVRHVRGQWSLDHHLVEEVRGSRGLGRQADVIECAALQSSVLVPVTD
jgi:hypothetical protein